MLVCLPACTLHCSGGRGLQTATCEYLCAADHDLTGQILWPAATLLANYIAAHPSILEACSCAVELGAGLGLVGLLAAQSCPVVLTDHNDVVLRVLQKNADLNQAQHNIRCSTDTLHTAVHANTLADFVKLLHACHCSQKQLHFKLSFLHGRTVPSSLSQTTLQVFKAGVEVAG